jgi:RND family efflux transporter MFP subunit
MTHKSGGASMPEKNANSTGKATDWESFVASDTAESRCRAWLALVCAQVSGARTAIILIEHPADQTYVPIAAWPDEAGTEVKQSGERLGAVIESALRDRRVAVKAVAESSGVTHLAWPLLVADRVAGIVALEAALPAKQADAALRVIHWGSAWLLNLLAERAHLHDVDARARLGSVLEATTALLRHRRLQQALFEASHVLRRQFEGTRVAIGLAEAARVRLTALSDAATFERRAPLVRAYEQAMEEAYDAHVAVRSPPPEADAASAEESAPAAPAHEDLRSISGAGAVLSFPLAVGARCLGVMTLERESQEFLARDLAWLEAFGALAAPIIEQRQRAEQGAFGRLRRDLRTVLARLFGPRHLTWKVATAACVTLALVLTLTPVDYRVSARTVVEGEVQRVIAAPFEGFIGAATARAGDTVKAGQLLAQLDDRELRIEEARWSSEHDQYENRLREAMANQDLVAMQVLGAQLRQASAQLDLVRKKIEHAQLRAPFDGVVVSGDLSQQIGAPVEVGKPLFEIAPLSSYRVILEVDEREIRHVRMDQPGRLVMTGIVGEPMDFKVAKVTPVATAEEGRNFFRVEAALPEASPRLRPGMEGVGKIEVGRRSLWWILTHGFSEWLILKLWTWMP